MPDFPRPIDETGDVVIPVKVVPGSSRTESAGMHGGAYKIKIAAPPEKGKANTVLIAFLADTLGLRKNAIQIKSGKTSQIKQVLIRGIMEKDIESLLG